MTICIDFDHTLCDMANVAQGYKMGPPMPGALESVIELQSRGITCVVFTARATRPDAIKAVDDWLKFFHFPAMPVTGIKINADVYLDDKAIRFTSWDQAMKAINA